MSDDPHSTPESPVNNALGALVLISIPVALIVMLGITGVAFVKGMGNSTLPAESPGAPSPAPVAVAAPVAAGDGVPEGIDPAQWAVGIETFKTCAACHGQDGKGLPVGPQLMAPSLIGSETLLGDPDLPILVVLKGIKKETTDYVGFMAALGAFPDDQIAGVLTYLRNNWGNKAAAISTEQVGAARERFSDFTDPTGIPRAEIPKFLEAHK